MTIKMIQWSISHTKSGNARLARIRSNKNYHSHQAGELTVQTTGNRQRTVRRISTRGTALKRIGSVRSLRGSLLGKEGLEVVERWTGMYHWICPPPRTRTAHRESWPVDFLFYSLHHMFVCFLNFDCFCNFLLRTVLLWTFLFPRYDWQTVHPVYTH